MSTEAVVEFSPKHFVRGESDELNVVLSSLVSSVLTADESLLSDCATPVSGKLLGCLRGGRRGGGSSRRRSAAAPRT